MAGGAQQDGSPSVENTPTGKYLSRADTLATPDSLAAYYNPYESSNNVLSQYMSGLSPYGNMAPQTDQNNTQFASDLASRTGAYQQSTTDALAAERARMIAANAAAMNAYQTARGNADLQAQYQGTINSLNSQLADLLAQKQTWQERSDSGSINWGDSNSGWYTGATGGLASLKGFDK